MIDYWVLMKHFEHFVVYHSKTLKWIASFCFIFATIILISPDVAARSVLPFVLYFFGNTVWLIDSYFHKQHAWLWTGSFFVVYDGLLIYSRLTNIDTTNWLRPIVEQLNYYLL